MTWALYPFFTAALYYLGARAKVTEFLWSRYPRWLDRVAVCASCSGFWYGLLVGALGYARGWEFLGLPGRSYETVLAVAICAVVWTPLVSVLHLLALERLIPEDPDAGAP